MTPNSLYFANQLTGFYMMATLSFNELKCFFAKTEGINTFINLDSHQAKIMKEKLKENKVASNFNSRYFCLLFYLAYILKYAVLCTIQVVFLIVKITK